MSEIVTISNGIIEAKISTKGAELISATYNGKERIWQGDPSIWAGHAPVLFPVCGGIKDDFIIVDGKKYDFKTKHGFARNSEFTVVSLEKTSVAFTLKDSEETLKEYPYNFTFRILYKLNGDSIGVYYFIENESNKDMLFNIGSHEAYALYGDMSEYSIELEDDFDSIDTTLIKNRFLSHDKKACKLNGNDLPLSFDVIDQIGEPVKGFLPNASFVFENIKSNRYTLKHNGEPVVSVYGADFKHLVVWMMKPGRYIAIEPWNGLPDYFDGDNIFENKKDIDVVKKGECKTFYHSITFYDEI